MQDWIFVLRVLFGLVMTEPSHADDDATELVLVTTLLSRASDGTAESMLFVTC
jgi:hypothetical protein